jgi:hypothetical protein
MKVSNRFGFDVSCGMENNQGRLYMAVGECQADWKF